MSAVKGFTVLSSLSLFSLAAVHSSKRPSVEFTQTALKLEHDFGQESVLPSARHGAKAAANLRPAALAGRVRQL